MNSIASAAEQQSSATELITSSLDDISRITNSALTIMDATTDSMHTLTQDVESIRTIISDMKESVR